MMDEPRRVPALRVRQWLANWNEFAFDEAQRQRKPEDHFYVLSLSAAELRALSGINRRGVDKGLKRSEDLGVQRHHDRDRSDEIRRYVDGGYPWSSISRRRREDPASEALKKPGWLPTAIVVNILQPGEVRGDTALEERDAVKIENPDGDHPVLVLPPAQEDGALPPIEIIDGQHRLFAFDADDETAKRYDLPVVAFVGLDLSWQAYLFWTINIKPVRINPSFAYDLYPLLREESWLSDADDTIHVYRESRAQELTEVLWASGLSPWHARINMLGGDRSAGPVSQAAFLRSLTLSLVKTWSSGGLFGGTQNGRDGLAWSRPQQGAFLLESWRLLAESVASTDAPWATAIREGDGALDLTLTDGGAIADPAFASRASLLATDQGVRAFQQVLNDIFYRRAQRWGLRTWLEPDDLPSDSVEAVSETIPSLREQPWFAKIGELVEMLTTFDWRSASAPELSAEERRIKQALRGSGGYKILRTDLLKHLAQGSSDEIAEVAAELAKA